MKRIFLLSLAFLLAGASVSSAALPAFTKFQLPNGMTVLLMEQHEVPIVSFDFIVKSGSVADPAGKEGLASLTASLLRRGTRARTSSQISAELDFIGGDLNAAASLEFTNGSAEFLKKDLSKGLELLSDVVLNPVFPSEEVTKLAAQRIDEIKAAKDRVANVIARYFNGYLYGEHPYARATSGDERSLAGVTRDDIVKFYETYYTPSNFILAVAGDFETAEMRRLLEARFGAWPSKNAPAVPVVAPRPVSGRRLLLVDKPDSTQTYFYVGNVGIHRTHPDRVGVAVVNTLFGGRFTSRLNTALRVDTGLTYGANSAFDQRKYAGPFNISSYTRNETTEKALDMTLELIDTLHARGITEAELRSVKAYMKGQFPPTMETTDRLASIIARLEFFGLDASDVNDYTAKIDAVTLEDTRRIIGQHFPKDNLVFVLVGKASEIEPIARKYAPQFDKKVITAPGF